MLIQLLQEVHDARLFIIITLALCLVMLISFGLHEYAHALVAYKCGDPTPKVQGRLTINPFAHIDYIGFLCCMFFGFGWAKPVVINPLNFRKFRSGLVATSLAGVTVNLILAFVGCGLFTAFFRFLAPAITNEYLFYFLYYFFNFLFMINLSLMVFNILPIPPLDGFNALDAMTKSNNKFVEFMRRYGTLILIAILLIFDNLLLSLMNIIATPMAMFWGWIFSL